MTDNPYLIVLKGLENETFRNTVAKNKDLPVTAPFDSCIADVLELINPTPESIAACVKLHLPAHLQKEYRELEFDHALAMVKYQQLVIESTVEMIHGSTSGLSPDDPAIILDKVARLARNYRVTPPEARGKEWDELEEREDDVMFPFLQYDISRGKMTLFAAYSGIGKTVMSFCFANMASQMNFKVLIIALRDWSEAELRRKARSLPKKENIKFAVYPDGCTLNDIDFEISTSQPDIVIVDAIPGINGTRLEDKGWLALGDIAKDMRPIAVKYDCHIFTTHQCVVLETLVKPGHLRDSKSHLLEHFDLGLGLGASDVADSTKVVSTLKVRHQESMTPFKIVFDYANLKYVEKGNYRSAVPNFVLDNI